ncbi:PQQ-dependent sugar dehydrogenase [Candidatus Uhrbacteria bacterium]|nr:PQQ-dependent sugar dehydrogenase [Candidatus Uhrbacteria bacterium]
MEKRNILIAVIFVLVAVWIGGASYWKYLRGVRPAFGPPPQDIVDLLAPGSGTNLTDYPLQLPPGFSISIFAHDLGKPRAMQWDDAGNLLVSIPEAGQVLALSDTNGDGVSDRTTPVLTGLNRPHGLALRCRDRCELYVAESHRVASYNYDSATLTADAQRVLVSLPDGGNHVTRSLLFMSAPNENRLLISVGSSCNVCEEQDPRRAKIWAYDVERQSLALFGRGLRNSVFMAIHPVTGAMWATEMGRDLLGDDLPPDEINIVTEGKDYGWPICYGKNVHDTDFDTNVYVQDPCHDKESSYIDIPAHSAPLGLAFVPEEGWPEEYWHDLIVASHGSWNRTVPTGYKLVRMDFDAEGNLLGVEDFITGWLLSTGALGRPVDVLVEPGGTMYVSDDKAGVIYRVRYTGTQTQDPNVMTTLDLPPASDVIHVTAPAPNELVGSPLTVTGEARGTWFFEASFPMQLEDAEGNVIAVGFVEAQGDWMTTEFVPFRGTIQFDAPASNQGTLVLMKDNPSGLPQFAEEVRIPVRFGTDAPRASGGCVITGCSGQLCADQEVVTTCEFLSEYACYRDARCGRRPGGSCGWVATPELTRCLAGE